MHSRHAHKFVLSLSLFFFYSVTALPLPRISGTISLPGSSKAPPGGVYVRVTALIKDYDGPESTMEFEIPAGQNSIPFSIQMPSAAAKFRLRFFCPQGGWMRNGYYSRSGAIPFRADRPEMWIDVSGGDVSGLNLVIPADAGARPYAEETRDAQDEARAIARRLIKPYYTEFEKVLVIHDYLVEHLTYYSDQAADSHHLGSISDIYRCNGLRAGVTVCNGYAVLFQTMANEVGLETRLVDMPGHEWNQVKIGGRFWHVDLSYNDHTSQYGVFLMSDAELELEGGRDWPHSQGAHNPDESFPYSASMAPHLSEIRGRGFHRFFGTIRLPPGDTAPAGGIVIWANEDQRYFIAPGRNSAFFALRLPVNGEEKTIQFSVKSRCRYLAKNYLNAEGRLSFEKKAAAQFDLSGPDHSNVDVTLVPGIEISGTIRLPSGVSAPAEGSAIGLDVFTEDDLLRYFSYKIPGGGSSISFSERVPESYARAGLVLHFDPEEELVSVSGGYYNGSSVPIVSWEEASRLHFGRESLTGVNLQMQKAFFLSGTVSLPPEMQAMQNDFPLKLKFYRYGENGSHREWSKSLLLRAGERSMTYRIRMPPESGVRGYKISVLDESGRFQRENFYSQRGPANEQTGDFLALHSRDTSEINFILNENRSSGPGR